MTIDEFARRCARGHSVRVDVDRRMPPPDRRRQSARLNAFILVMADEARRQARRRPIANSPPGKIAVRCTACRCRSRICSTSPARRPPPPRACARDTSPTHDAPLITRLRQAGAVIIGKTNLHEFAFGTTNEDSAFGPTRHPLDPTRSPGGSSGGSAVSLVAGMALATLGTDTGGSIRIPAAICGTVGLKPTYGETADRRRRCRCRERSITRAR